MRHLLLFWYDYNLLRNSHCTETAIHMKVVKLLCVHGYKLYTSISLCALALKKKKCTPKNICH